MLHQSIIIKLHKPHIQFPTRLGLSLLTIQHESVTDEYKSQAEEIFSGLKVSIYSKLTFQKANIYISQQDDTKYQNIADQIKLFLVERTKLLEKKISDWNLETIKLQRRWIPKLVVYTEAK